MITNASIFWDIENCQPPRSTKINTIKRSLMTLCYNHNLNIESINAIGSEHAFRPSLKEELKASNIIYKNSRLPGSLFKPNAADIKIIYNILNKCLENKPPYTIILISGDSDFEQLITILKEHGFKTILIYPKNTNPKILSSADIALEWISILFGNCNSYESKEETIKQIDFADLADLSICSDLTDSSISSDLSSLSDSVISTSSKIYKPIVQYTHKFCVVEFYSGKTYGEYNIPDDIVLGIHDIVEVEDIIGQKISWNIGRVVGVIFKKKKMPKFNVLAKITLPRFNIQLENKLDLDKALLNKSRENLHLVKAIVTIVSCDFRWDNLGITIRYVTKEKNKIDFQEFKNFICEAYKINVYMKPAKYCKDRENCSFKFCKFHH